MKLRIFMDFAVPPDALALLEKGTAGHELIFSETPNTSVLAEAPADPRLATADVAFGQPDPKAIEAAPGLRWIHISTSGITRYDNQAFREAMKRRKIPVSNSAHVYNEACALHVLSFMLAQSRRLPVALGLRVEGGTPAWHALRGSCVLLQGQSALIVGYGAIGERLAEMLRPLGVKISAHRRSPQGDETVPMISTAALPGALAEADHVVNILPDSAATRRYFDADRFGFFKPGAVFYNIGRGSTVDQEALLAALRSRHLAAAWLDVSEPEPLPAEHPLMNEPNCHVTPHIAGGHAGEAVTLVRHFLANLDRFVKGEPLLDRVV